MDKLIEEYAAKLRTIYYERTAGDNTFEGILFEFAQEVKEELSK